jgi:hypothetical protein
MKVKKKYRDVLLSILGLLLVCMYPCIYMYVSNIGETHIDLIYAPLFVFFIISIAVYLIGLLLFKNTFKAGIVSCAFMIFFINYNIIFNIICIVLSVIPTGYNMALLLILWCAILVILSIKKMDFELVNTVVIITFGALILINVCTAVPKFISMKECDGFVEVEQYAQKRDNTPDIYYIFLDEYGGSENLKYYYDFDNSKFLDNLTSKGFSISESTYNYEGILTKEIMPNILNLQYVTSIDGVQSNNIKYFKNPVLFRFVKDLGYNIDVINHQKILNTEGTNVLFESSPDCIFAGVDRDVDGYLIDNSFIREISSFIAFRTKKDEATISNTKFTKYKDELKLAVETLKQSAKHTGDGPTMTMCYLQIPHHPFVFDENGQPINDDSQAYNWHNKELYLNQLKYTNSLLEDCVDNILKDNPDSVIVIQSDHGARYPMFEMNSYRKSEYDAKAESEKMQNVLNCVYMGKDNSGIEIEGETALNTWRMILNDVFGTDYKKIYPEKRYVYKWRFKMK